MWRWNILAAVIIGGLIGAGFALPALWNFIAQDRCLDSGGRGRQRPSPVDTRNLCREGSSWH